MGRTARSRLAALWLAMCAGPVPAAPLMISPTTIAVKPGTNSAVIEIANASDAPTDLQFRAYAWRQADGQDVLTPTDDLIISPPMVTIPPHAKQSFRVIRVARTDGGSAEPAYRLRLNELPRATGQNAIAINLEFSLPVFFGRADAAPALRWTQQDGRVIVRNDGTGHVRLNEVTVRDAAGAAVPVARSAYVLAGGWRSFALPAGARAPQSLIATSDRGSTNVPLAALAAR